MHNLASAHDEALRRRAYVVERKASDERQRVLAGRLQDLNVARRHDLGGFHLILKLSAERLERDRVALSNVAQWTKESCRDDQSERRCPLRPAKPFRRCGRRRASEFLANLPGRRWRSARGEESPSLQSRFPRSAGCGSFTLARTLEFRLFDRLIGTCVCRRRSPRNRARGCRPPGKSRTLREA